MELPFDLEEIPYRYIVGIDLGTTNSAVAFVDRTLPEAERRIIQFLNIPQLTGLKEVGLRPVLPSFLYLPGPYELPPGSVALPWQPERDYAVGEFAREQGALVPGRLVASAKSWLCHGGVDRTAPILPWAAGDEVARVSPVEASSRYLVHIREAWNELMAKGRDECRLEEQLVILTVPASFDEVARELTVAAAREAGLPRAVLLEEPLAAFYAWLSRHEQDWQPQMQAGQVILVCDVGGGTTDFTIVAVREGEHGLRFDRLAVGDHLMLGGDNMDHTLARHLELELMKRPGRLDSKRWHQLTHECRKAKEMLLSDATRQPAVDITLMGSGSKLIGDTLKGTLSQGRVEDLILEGFFPTIPVTDLPGHEARRGLSEWGLPYVQDPAVTRHLAAFWQSQRALLAQETERTAPYPDFVLFNGGALTPSSIRRRLGSVIAGWFRAETPESWEPKELENPHPELAVAIGAAYYGLVRLGEGVRVGAGSPRAYYVAVAAAAPAGSPSPAASPSEPQPASEMPPAPEQAPGLGPQPGAEVHPEAGPVSSTEPELGTGPELDSELAPGAASGSARAVCLVPRGTEEGFQAELAEPAFEVRTNQPVSFQLFSSSTRLGDHLGDVVTLGADEVSVLPPIRTVLRFGRRAEAITLPAHIALRLTEVGTLELWCRSQNTGHRWQLQFDVRQEVETPETPAPGETLEASLVEQAREAARAAFQGGGPGADQLPERLAKDLVSILETAKEKWPTSLIRQLADTLLECHQGRAPTPKHEARWLNLLGFCMRPGFGNPVDEWRMKQIWKLFPQDLQFPRQAQGRMEWWIFWRRVAGGLSAGQQWHIFQKISPSLQPQEKKKKGARKGGRKLGGQEEIEVWMALANFERLPAETKVELGRSLLAKLRRTKPKQQELWALSRLGARVPFYGPLDRVIPSGEAASWLDALLALNLPVTDALAYALVQLARLTGDRSRDLDEADRARVERCLEQLSKGRTRFVELLTQPETVLQLQDQAWIFGESLPSGLVLSSDPAN